MTYVPCSNGKHDLRAVYTDGSDMEASVVRWCANCGGIVIDVDFDGRTAPGSIMKLTLPRCSLG